MNNAGKGRTSRGRSPVVVVHRVSAAVVGRLLVVRLVAQVAVVSRIGLAVDETLVVVAVAEHAEPGPLRLGALPALQLWRRLRGPPDAQCRLAHNQKPRLLKSCSLDTFKHKK